MKKTILILPMLALAACASPRESCISDARAEVEVLQLQIDRKRLVIERGYAERQFEDVTTIDTTCTGYREDGTPFTYPCQEVARTTRTEPVPINADAERQALAVLERRLATVQGGLNGRIRQCIAIHPE